MFAAAASPPDRGIADELALSKVSPNGLSLIDRGVGSRTSSARLGRASKPASQNLWTSEQDECLLHLRDVAQLDWIRVVTYFPAVTLSAVKSRYERLHKPKIPHQIVRDQQTSRVHRHRKAKSRAAPTCGKAEPKAKEKRLIQPVTASRGQPTTILAEHHNTPRRRSVVGKGSNCKDITWLTSLIGEDPRQRTSRSGRPIRHPFRDRPSEGYL